LSKAELLELRKEHAKILGALKTTRFLTQNYTPPENCTEVGSCDEWKTFYHSLKKLDEELVVHFRVEDRHIFGIIADDPLAQQPDLEYSDELRTF